MQNFSVQQRSDLIKYFVSELLTEKWTAQVMTETMCYVIIPMLKDAEKKQEMQELLPDGLLDLVFETICKQQSANQIRQYLSCVCNFHNSSVVHCEFHCLLVHSCDCTQLVACTCILATFAPCH
jgi:hypothetical protein